MRTIRKIHQARFSPIADLTLRVPEEHNILFYTMRGEMYVNAMQVKALQPVEFGKEGAMINISAGSDSVILFGHAMRLNEPVVARGPFVMNTEEEIAQAHADFPNGSRMYFFLFATFPTSI